MESGLVASGRRVGLRGRAGECSVLDGLLGDIRRSKSRSLVLSGEAGIGKTALLGYLIDRAPDLTVLRAAGVESEMELAYAGLQQLCAPLLERLERLPPPQRGALEIVFGLSGGPPPDRFLVGLGVLSLFSEEAEGRSLLCVVDDAHWLDRSSALTLAFVTRRLLAEPVAIVFAAREPLEYLAHVSELEVRGLGDGDARALLASVVRFKLDGRVRDRIIAETRGNPLALLELPKGLTPTQLAGGFALPEVERLPGRIEQSFISQLAALPEDTRWLLLIAAAEPTGDPLLLWGAAHSLGIEPAAAGPAEARALLAIDERVTFRHPLVRSAAYRSSPVDDRRAAHLALAQASDPTADPDRRAWHLAAAASGPDEQVATELERSAGRAQSRGGFASTAAFLQRAVALSADPAARAERALAAATASFQVGDFDRAVRLLARAGEGPIDELQRARVEMVRGQITFAFNRGGDAPSLLLDAAQRLDTLDVTLARETYMEALMAAQFAGRLMPGGVQRIAEAARSAPPSPAPGPQDLLLDGFAVMITEGHSAAEPLLRRALDAFVDKDVTAKGGFRWLSLAIQAAQEIWDHDTWYDLAMLQLKLVRDVGALTMLPLALMAVACAHVSAGELVAAMSVIADQKSATEATGSQLAPYGGLMLSAWRGRETDLSALIDATLEDAVPRGEGIGVSACQWVSTVLCNGLGRYEHAVRAAQELLEPPRKMDWPLTAALPELIEGAVRIGRAADAHAAFQLLSELTRPSRSCWALGIEARCRALLSDGAEADCLYREAVERLGHTRLRPELARARLLYGEWLRRNHRRADARAELRAAHELFVAIGMEAFADRTANELLATGEIVRSRTVETRDDLTPHERQIAELARDGLSNPEIGARLFLSPRTVEWHLRKVFGKLGIRSRRDLAQVLSPVGSAVGQRLDHAAAE